MRLKRIMLIRENGERDLSVSAPSGMTSSININFNFHPSEGKPWPFELDFRVECGKPGDKPGELIETIYLYKSSYAVEFEDIEDNDTSKPVDSEAAAEAVWPFIRPYAVSSFQRHEILGVELPLNLPHQTMKAEEASESVANKDN